MFLSIGLVPFLSLLFIEHWKCSFWLPRFEEAECLQSEWEDVCLNWHQSLKKLKHCQRELSKAKKRLSETLGSLSERSPRKTLVGVLVFSRYRLGLEHLPSIRACQKCDAPILVADILLSKRTVAINAFGFRKAGDRMALHDHPRIRGFIKCVRGSMKISNCLFPHNLCL